ncbi:hypothetical protein C2S53_014641 [Perilla frutescens var. hirtella]|uniref:Secreted protein n=1 Tax=Perilla frutescens var. hirtella TaxID=608512 RepID=A0AAD4IUS6_PERFH|nr:hypothetical protein C2S53_014641 [Perilla frutescens var. hirtella]
MAMAALILLLLSSPTVARHYPAVESAPSTALASRNGAYAVMTPLMNHNQGTFHRHEVKNCMPKGSRRSSAPSRYVNYHTFGSSSRCGSGSQPPPTKP